MTVGVVYRNYVTKCITKRLELAMSIFCKAQFLTQIFYRTDDQTFP